MRKIHAIDIVPDKPVLGTKDDKHLVTSLRLSYKAWYSRTIHYKYAHSTGHYRHDGSPKQKFEYFLFSDDVGNQYSDEECKLFSNYLEKETATGNLKSEKKDGKN